MNIDERVATLIDRLTCDLKAALSREVVEQLELYCAAIELIAEDLQAADAGKLRLASEHMAFGLIGMSDAGIERKKTLLATWRDPVTLDRRH